MMMWDKRVVNLIEEYVGEYLVACSVANVDDGFKWGFVGVYGPNVDSNRRLLWDEIAALCSWWYCSWCIGGDFDITRSPSERSGDSSIGPAMAYFSSLIFELNLVDLPLAGGDYIWPSNERAWSKLDRFIVSPSWEAHFPNLCQKRLPRLCSDHVPSYWIVGASMRGEDTFNPKTCG
ncbi:hypothetical protein I3842_01G085700 [Carya illinoinensis]|uniref:Endonuclease/exonuclease/phosphatase domain-containing protein n=1 Tax=Carya illinoinensis TaxID=32201 RepID=A0A922FY32_CARIL|nr:hypothetical protein I3842_01G085700 [Carya illinoinensis]